MFTRNVLYSFAMYFVCKLKMLYGSKMIKDCLNIIF